MCTGLRVKCLFFLSYFNIKLEFSQQTFEKYSNIKFRENRLVGDELFHANGRTDGRTDMTNLIVAFRNFAGVPKNESS